MPAPKGHKRYGGRTKGTPNKSTSAILERCQAAGVNPLDVLIEYLGKPDPALHESAQQVHIAQRFNAAKELMQYTFPKRKALEISLDQISDEEFDAEVERRIAERENKAL